MRIDCIVMAGGKASRLGGVEKPLVSVCGGRPMVLGVLEAASRVCDRILMVYSRHTRGIEVLCRTLAFPGLQCLEGSGEGYVEDLRTALGLVRVPALVLPADTPHIDWVYLDDFLGKAIAAPGSVVNLVTSKGPTGISLFKDRGGSWWDIEYPHAPAFIDVDTPEDLEEAEEECS